MHPKVRIATSLQCGFNKLPCHTYDHCLFYVPVTQERSGKEPHIKTDFAHFFFFLSSSSHLYLNCEGCWGTTDDFATSFLHFSLFSTALWDLATPGLSIPWCCLPTSSFVSFVFFPPVHCVLEDCFGQTWWTGDMTILLQFASFYNGQEVFVWSICQLDLGNEFFLTRWN